MVMLTRTGFRWIGSWRDGTLVADEVMKELCMAVVVMEQKCAPAAARCPDRMRWQKPDLTGKVLSTYLIGLLAGVG